MKKKKKHKNNRCKKKNNNTNEIEDNKVQEFETIEEIYDDIDNNESRPNNSKNIIKETS